MKDWGVPVPSALLVHAQLTASAKLVWMLHAARSFTWARDIDPASDSGLSRPTAKVAVRQLVKANWAPGGQASRRWSARARPGAALAAALPVHLLIDRRLHAQAKVLYGVLQAVPEFSRSEQAGRFTYAALRGMTGLGVNTLKAAVGELARTEWLEVSQENRRTPVCFRVLNPVAARAEAWITQARFRIEEAPDSIRHETIMREFLSLLVDSENFEDDAEPGFLINPTTKKLMQFDRFYAPAVAFEYNGAHHYGATSYCTEEESAAQQGRDLMKAARCAQNGVLLVVVRRSDLTLEGMLEKIRPTGLPLRDLLGLEAVAAFLDTCGKGHQGRGERAQRK